jgi:ribosomal-protein-alanine N-acetyltransferase
MSEGDTAPESLDTEAPLLTPRLALAPLRAEHAALLFESLQDPRLYTYIPDDPPDSLQALEARYHRWERRASPDGHEVWLNWAAQSRATGEWVGTFQATIMEDRQALLAYMIFPPFQRQGFAREGCARVVHYLLDACAVGVVAAEIDTRNAASIALVESLGFRLVATTYEADTFKGAVSDEHRYDRATALHTPSSRA